MTESIYFYYTAFIDANTYSSWQLLKYDFEENVFPLRGQI